MRGKKDFLGFNDTYSNFKHLISSMKNVLLQTCDVSVANSKT